jgi:hypothetical protein
MPREIKDVHGIRRDGDSRSDLPERPGLLEDAHRHAETLQRKGGREAADPGPDDRDRAVKVARAIESPRFLRPHSAGCQAQVGLHLPDQDLAWLGGGKPALPGRRQASGVSRIQCALRFKVHPAPGDVHVREWRIGDRDALAGVQARDVEAKPRPHWRSRARPTRRVGARGYRRPWLTAPIATRRGA